MPDSNRAQAHVEIGKTDPEQAQPRPKHVAAIETGHARVSAIACLGSGKLIQKSAGQMTERVTAKRIAAEQNDVNCKHDGANTNSKSIWKPRRFPNVDGEHDQKKHREIEKISMHILHNERE